MADLNNIEPGQVLHDYHKVRQGNTALRKEGHWRVVVIEIDLVKRQALISWNGNPPRWMSEKNLKAFRVKEKKPNN